MGRRPPRPLTLDTGALIAFEKRGREVAVLVQRAKDAALPIVVPAGVVAQACWSGYRQARLAALLGSRDARIETLTALRARAVGELCGRSGATDIVDASVVLAARQYGGLVATSDPDDLRQIDPALPVVGV